MKKILSILLCTMLIFSTLLFTCSTASAAEDDGNIPGLRTTMMAGYFHLFKNGAGNGVKITELPPYWDVLMCAFGEPDSATTGNVIFDPTKEGVYATDEEFIADVEAAHKRGQKVTLSIGGQYGIVTLETAESAEKFVETVGGAIAKYGLDGLDIDLEGSSLTMANETDIRNPVTPCIVNLIYAIKRICAQNGDDFILTYTPETRRCQDGIAFYNGSSGTYLPLLEATREELSWLQVQYYNVANCYSPDGLLTNFGTVDFNCRLMDMMLEGFYVGQSANMGQSEATYFEGLRPDQMVMGVPSGPNSAGTGQMSYDDYCTAMDLMLNGGTTSTGYVVKNPSKSFRGIMTWSANWDIHQSYNFSDPIHKYLLEVNGYELDGSEVDTPQSLKITSVSADKTSAKIDESAEWTVAASGEGTLSYKFDVYKDGVLLSEGVYGASSAFTYTFPDSGTYFVKASVTDSSGKTASLSSDTIAVSGELKINALSIETDAASLTVTADAVGGKRNYTYFFYVLQDGRVYDSAVFSQQNSVSLILPSGEAEIRVYVKDSAGTLVVRSDTIN